jgi:uncharacterized protein (TIGR03000 family)
MTFLVLACCGWWWLLAGSTSVPRFLGAHAVAGAVQQAPAAITVLVPADAALFFDGDPTAEKGAERRFVTPPLEVGKKYHYEIRVRWQEGGKTVERTRKVAVSGGARVRVDFRQEKPGQDKTDPAAEDKQVVDSTAAPRPSASAVNFRKELGLPFPTLSTLGPRISAARRAHDPVALANAASELAVAEKVSGKKASLTSAAVLKEAAELAGMKRQVAEQKAVLHISEQIAADQELTANVRKDIALAEQQAKADAAAARPNQEPTWTPRTVVVNNYTTQYIDLWVNGNPKGQVAPGQTQTFVIEHRWNPTVLTGYGDEDSSYPWKRIIWGRFTTYTWNING